MREYVCVRSASTEFCRLLRDFRRVKTSLFRNWDGIQRRQQTTDLNAAH